MKPKTLHAAAFVCCLIVSLTSSFAAAGEFSNGSVQAEPQPVIGSLRLITGLISRADGDRCPMSPTCSAYSLQAMQTHGFIKGWIMTCDRLMRCGRDELRLSDTVRVNGRIHSHDPLEHNDFW